jgi:hypothetical protein
VAAFAVREGDWLSQRLVAAFASLLMPMKNNPLLATSNRKSAKGSFKRTIKIELIPWGLAIAARALFSNALDMMKNRAIMVLCAQMFIALQPQGMIQKAGRRHCGGLLSV